MPIAPLRSKVVGKGAPNRDESWALTEERDEDPASALLSSRSFYFAERHETIDLEVIDGVDLERIERDVDIEALQRHLEMLTYGDLSKAGTGDATFLKIFRLSQLMVEYLLNVQDILAEGLEQVSTSCKEAKRHRDKYREKTRVQDEKIKALRSQLKARRQTAQAYSGLVLREANAPPRHWRDDPPAPRRSYDDDAPAPRRARTPDDYEQRNESGEMTVYVSAADGTTARHTVGEVSTARELRSKLGAPGRLVFRGNELTPDVVLADAGVRHGDTILIVHREGVDRDARDQRHDLDQRIATLESSIKGEMAVQPAPGCLAGALEDDDGDDDAFASVPRSTVASGPPRTPHAAEAPADVTQLRAMEERLKAQMDALEEKMLGLARQPREPTPAQPREPTPAEDPTPRKPATPPPRDPTPQPTPQPRPETSWTLRCAVGFGEAGDDVDGSDGSVDAVVNAGDAVLDVRAAIAEKLDVEVDRVVLTVGGRDAADVRALADLRAVLGAAAGDAVPPGCATAAAGLEDALAARQAAWRDLPSLGAASALSQAEVSKIEVRLQALHNLVESVDKCPGFDDDMVARLQGALATVCDGVPPAVAEAIARIKDHVEERAMLLAARGQWSD
ncbi:zinc finger protein [Aureococcus anophagefferens]|nr:zinc finger protein [Aureococcus anophagefferens]